MLHITKNYALTILCGEPHNVCHGEGKLLGLPMNRALTDDHGVPYDIVCGTFFVAGLKEDEFCLADGAADRKVQGQIQQRNDPLCPETAGGA